MKEALGTVKSNHQKLLRAVFVNKISVTQGNSTKENFNKYFTEIGPNVV